MKPTIDQHDRDLAVNALYGNYLVSAGAGSGKTTIIKYRIHKMLKDSLKEKDPSKRISLSDFLVVTFTNKAAHEMKDRVREELSKDPETAHLIPELEGSSIMTFDAFALELVKTYHYKLGIDSDVQLIDQAVLMTQERKMVDEIFERRGALALKGDDPSFANLIASFCLKETSNLAGFIVECMELWSLQEDKKAFIDSYIETHYSKAFIQSMIEEYISYIRYLTNSYLRRVRYEIEDDLISIPDEEFLQGFLEKKTLTEMVEYVSTAKWKKARTKADASSKEAHSSITKAWNKEVKDSLLSLVSEEQVIDSWMDNRGHMEVIIEILRELDEKMARFKSEHAAYSFADIASLARQLASDEEIGKALRSRYKFIMVDEYQDTSDLQENFISLLSSGSVFAVGDLKQSIYRFRHANPAIFKRKFDEYGKGNGGTLLTLSSNFRSRESILKTVNSIFAQIMSAECGDIDYSDHQALDFGQEKYSDTEDRENHDFDVISYVKDSDYYPGEQEARIIANDIIEKLESGYKVLDGGNWRPCVPGDFCILDKRKANFPAYSKVFGEAKIPFMAFGNADPDMDVMTVMIALIRLINAIRDGVHGKTLRHLYASIKRSFLYQSTDEELYYALKDSTYKDDPIVSNVKESLGKLSNKSVKEIVDWAIDNYHVVESLPRLGAVKADFERIEYFRQLAEQCSTFGWGLNDFCEYFDLIKAYGEKLEADDKSDGTGLVQMMSMHASKGLQFKIVYLTELDAITTSKSDGRALTVSHDYGFLMPLDGAGSGKGLPHVMSRQLADKASISEAMRLLYVAMTRAEEKLIAIYPLTTNKAGDIKFSECTDPRDAKKLIDFLACTKDFEITKMAKDFTLKTYSAAAKTETSLPLEYKEPRAIKSIAYEGERASKGASPDLDMKVLRYGEALHKYLELTDFHDKDLSWIKTEKEREIVRKVIELDIFADVENARVYHEYEYFDQESGHNGIIDLLLVYPDKSVIVDFKASKIDDPAYAKQLATYERFVSSAFGKPCEKYLLSILGGRYKRVE